MRIDQGLYASSCRLVAADALPPLIVTGRLPQLTLTNSCLASQLLQPPIPGSSLHRLASEAAADTLQNAGIVSGRLSEFRHPDSVSWPIRAALFLACGTSGAALLAKVYGLTSMQTATLALAAPCSVGLLVVWMWSMRTSREALTSTLSLGFIGGIAGTIAYDLVRVPFHLMGQRIFAPIGAYGVWISGASTSSRFTEVIGWTYHFSNGITFGMMYALFFRGRAWWWAVVWGLLLETIALGSPFGRIFSVTGNYSAIGIAYAGHIAWGIPLGLLVQHSDATLAYLARTPDSLKWSTFLLGCVALAWPMFSTARIQRDKDVIPREFRAENDFLRPDWVRIQRGAVVRILNPGADSIWVRILEHDIRIGPGQRQLIPFPRPGVHQAFVETTRRSRSSFVIVEPVEHVR